MSMRALLEARLPGQLDDAVDLVAAVLAIVTTVTPRRQRDALARTPVPLVDGQDLTGR